MSLAALCLLPSALWHVPSAYFLPRAVVPPALCLHLSLPYPMLSLPKINMPYACHPLLPCPVPTPKPPALPYNGSAPILLVSIMSLYTLLFILCLVVHPDQILGKIFNL